MSMDFIDLDNELKKAPKSWLFSLLITVVQECTKQKVFISDKHMIEMVGKIASATNAGIDNREDTIHHPESQDSPSQAPKDCLLKNLCELIVEFRQTAKILRLKGDIAGSTVADAAADRLHEVVSKYGRGEEE